MTDRDLRSRVLAQGRSPDAPIMDVVSTPIVTLREEATVGEALSLMLERWIHHVPITEGSGSVWGSSPTPT